MVNDEKMAQFFCRRIWSRFLRIWLSLIFLTSWVCAEMYGPDGEVLKPDTEECASCAFSAIQAKAKYDQGGEENVFMSVNDWIKILEQGCQGDKACPSLIRKYGRAMGGALVDFVQDGDDAEERGMDVGEFQAALCHKYADVCKVAYGFPSIRQVKFKVPIGSGVDVGIFKRGSAQSGDQPMKPEVVLAPGQSHTFYPTQGTALRKDFAFRFMPVDDLSCPGHGSLSADESKCLIRCGTKKSASCRHAEKLCHKLDECDTIALDNTKKNGYLKSISIKWESPMLLDIFLTGELYQAYEIGGHPDFDTTVPNKIPNMKIPKPEFWDEEEDGDWAPPLVENTDNLKKNPRFAAFKNGEVAGQIAHRGGVIDGKNTDGGNNGLDDVPAIKKKKEKPMKMKKQANSEL